MNDSPCFLPQVVALAACILLAGELRIPQVLHEDTSMIMCNFNDGNGEMGNQINFPGNFASYMITKFRFQFDFTGIPPVA